MVLKENDNARSLIIIEKGELEVYTKFEGNIFVLERLHAGSVINSRSFFMEDLMHVFIRSKGQSSLIIITQDMIAKLKTEDSEFEREIDMYKGKILIRGKSYPLDYIKGTGQFSETE